MKKITQSLLILSLLLSVSCASEPKITNIIDENIAIAEPQVDLLLKASLSDDEIKIPKSYANGQIVYTYMKGWTSGFFAGTLWYMYELTGDEKWAEAATTHTEYLEPIKYLTTNHDIGFMIHDSFGNGLRLKDREEYKDIIVIAAKSLATRFREVPGIIQSWDTKYGWQSKRGWDTPVIIDNMMNLELLFDATKFSGDSTFYNIAVSHADRTMENHFRDDYSCFHVVDYDSKTGSIRSQGTAQGAADDSAWARGQAWAVYGYLICYRGTGDEKYLDFAENIANFILNDENMPVDLVPYWDYDTDQIPFAHKDASSAAIIASALYEMYTYTDNKEYLVAADKMIESLSSDAYRAKVGENGGFILTRSVGSIPHYNEIGVPLNYADYYFLEALIHKSKIQKGEPVY